MTILPIPLPIDPIIPEIIENLNTSNAVILQASPGAGKSTRVPKALTAITDKTILILEPRRLAARLCAERVAAESGEKCGDTIGFQVRYSKQESKKTKVKYITEGIFLRMFLSDPMLSQIGCVVIDEFHERHIHTDVTLMLVKQLQQSTRPDLKLVIMSATLEMKNLSDYLPQAKVFVCTGTNYPVEIEYLAAADQNRSLETKVYFVVDDILKNLDPAVKPRDDKAAPRDDKAALRGNKAPGHILVFLPGAFEIKKSAEMLSDLKKKYNIVIYELRADIPFDEQQKIFEPSQQTKVILSTNVAETSITIENVTAVIDSGLAKIATHASWSGLSRLEIKSISQASCIQRAGRAGRTQSGIAKRLFSQFDFGTRQKFEVPEIQRLDLAQTLLELKNVQTLSTQSIWDLPWFDPPSKSSIEAASSLLQNLGAFDAENQLTSVGKEISKFPLHPRLSRILYEAGKQKVLPQSILVVSLISEGMIFFKNSEPADVSHSDIKYQLDVLKLVLQKEEIPFSKKKLIDFSQVKKVESLSRYLCEITSSSFQNCFQDISNEKLSVILISAFSDRICKKKNNTELNLCLGGGAFLSKFSMVQDDDFLIAIEAEQTVGTSAKTHIRICHGVDPNLLLRCCPHWISEKKEIFWDNDRKMARSLDQILYGKIVLSEQQAFTAPKEFEEILKKQLAAAWPKPFEDDLALQYLKIRKKLAENAGYTLDISSFEDDEFELLLYHICEGKKSFGEILNQSLEQYLSELINPSQLALLNSLFPTHLVVGKGKKVKIHYEESKPPFISTRLQDLFGMVQTPKICNQRVSLVVHLLAPNMQVIQVTNDLVGFWKRDYPHVKKDLSRRYPRHKWPDDPTRPPDTK